VANDGLSGVVVAVELFRRLSAKPRKFTYKLVLPPSTMGTEFYLARMNDAERSKILEAVCFFMVGSRTPLAVQRSYQCRAVLEDLLLDVMKHHELECRVGESGTIQINDDYIWEAHGIPTCAIQRYPYPEYHSSLDTASIIDPSRLNEVVDLAAEAIDRLDNARLIHRTFTGTVCLSNPRIDLYVDPGQETFGETCAPRQRQLRRLMDLIPKIPVPTTDLHLAKETGLGLVDVNDYLQRWADKGLLEIA
jgi:aminopeptidase-like protein